MNINIIYYTKFGNTEKIADAIAKRLKESGNNVNKLPVDELSKIDFKKLDLLIIGSPTHEMNIPKNVGKEIDRIPKNALKDLAIAAFDTSYKMPGFLNFLTAGKKLNKKLKKLGGKPVVKPQIFIVKGKEGPLLKGELNNSQVWADKVLAHVKKD